MVKNFYSGTLVVVFKIAVQLNAARNKQKLPKGSTFNSHSEITAGITSAFCLSFNFALHFFEGVVIVSLIFLRSSVLGFFKFYFWLRRVFVAACGIFSSCSEWALLFVAVRRLLIGWLLLLQSTGSRRAGSRVQAQ